MRYTIALQNTEARCHIDAGTGVVNFNEVRLLPHEAAMLADALNECADMAETKAATHAARARIAPLMESGVVGAVLAAG